MPCLVEGLLHRSGLGQLASKPGVGKSPLAADLCIAVSNPTMDGDPAYWAGLRVLRHGAVVYVALEASETVHGYLAEQEAARFGTVDGSARRDVWLIEEPELLLAEPDGSMSALERIGHDVDSAGLNPVLYVFDTQVDMLGGVDDYKGTAVTPLIDKLRRWCVARDAFGLLLHHTTHSQDRGSGSINILGKVDTAMVVTKDRDEVLSLEVTKRKGLGKPQGVATAKFDTGPAVGTAQLRWVLTGADAADLKVAEDAERDVQKDTRTAEWLEHLMPKEGELWTDSTGKDRDLVWSNADAVRSMQALAERPTAEGGPVEVHVDRRYISPILDRLASEGRIVDLVQQWKSGMGHKWQSRGSSEPPEADVVA
ncbi:AAA family ATPase [Janibacter melonis]|uniref:AAA family ATPase n=2 Tax=Janibacter melonis TaxID=262209 RepID=A0A5P8FJP4_9MICO|nr:AAA family ATPase [Janibacter melonis]